MIRLKYCEPQQALMGGAYDQTQDILLYLQRSFKEDCEKWEEMKLYNQSVSNINLLFY